MGDRNRVNDIIAIVLMLIIVFSPLPLGSNRPVFWAISGALIFAATGVFLAALAVGKVRLRIPLKHVATVVGLSLTYWAYIAFSPNGDILAALRTLSYISFFLLMVQVCTNRFRASWIATTTLVAVTIYAAIGFAMLYGKIEMPAALGLSAYSENAHATFVNRNSYATYLGFGILLGAALWIDRSRRFSDGMLALSDEKLVFGGVSIALMLVTLISTNSRMGVAAFGIAAGFFLLVLTLKQARVAFWTMFGVMTGALLLVGLVFRLYGSNLLDRLGSVERDADVRYALYEQVLEMIRARPWAGHGADSFEVAFPAYHRLPVSPDLVWDKAHNTYLTNWAETGVIIGSIPVLLGLVVFYQLLRVVYRRQRRFVYSLLGASVVLQGAIHSTVDFSLEIQANMYLLLTIIALGYAEAMRPAKRSVPDV